MKRLLTVAAAMICIVAAPAKADLVCAKGSLRDLNAEIVCNQYRITGASQLWSPG